MIGLCPGLPASSFQCFPISYYIAEIHIFYIHELCTSSVSVPFVSCFFERRSLVIRDLSPFPFRHILLDMFFARSVAFITLQTLGRVTFASSALTESLLAQGLLGSHFGVPGVNASFDYVIAGGGTAGLTLAKRLAENNSVTVAVIEAGDFYEFSNGNFSEIPAYAAEFTGSYPLLKNPLLDWYQYTERQAVSCGYFGIR